MFVYSALSYTSLPSARLKGCFRVFLANVSYFKDKGRYLLEFKIRLRYGRYLLANVSYFEIMLEYSLLCMKIGAVLESADNSVRKERELFAG